MEWNVELRKGGLEAVATLVSGAFDLETATSDVFQRLRDLGAANGLRPEQLSEMLARYAAQQAPADGVIVARGEPPRPGSDAQLQFHFPVHPTPLAEGTDPFATYAQNVVYPGQVLLEKTPSSPGIPGKSLAGSPLPATDGADLPVSAEKGVAVDEDGTTFTATTYGVALFQRGQLRVLSALDVADDRMEARLTVLPYPEIDDDEAQVEKLLAALATLEVTDGLDREALAEAVRTARVEGRPVPNVVVARGREPVDGREPDYRLLLDAQKKVGKVLDGDRIDFREAEMVKNVARGDRLAEIIPGITPVPGVRVDGTQLRPRLARAEGIKPGQNVAPSEDGLHILADVEGMLVVKGNKFHVADEYLVPGDVDYRTGNIRASGKVVVRGQVKPGFQVHGGKGVEILQDVEEAVIEAHGAVVIRGGVTGGSRIQAAQNVEVKYLQNSRVETEGDLEVKLSVTNSEIYIKGKLRAMGSQGAILGGEVNAALGIEARSIGSPSSKTHVAVGVDLLLVREIEGIDKERTAVVEELNSLQSTLGRNFLKDPRAALMAMPVPMRKAKIEMLQRMKALYQKEGDLRAQRDMLGYMNQDLRKAEIAVHGEIQAGTSVTVHTARLTLPEALRHVLFYFDADQGRVAWRRL